MNKLIQIILNRSYSAKYRYGEYTSRKKLNQYDPNLRIGFDRISELTGTSGRYYWKAYDLVSLLELHKPKSILELGSGRTSCVFASYAAKHDSQYIAFEQDEKWEKAVNSIIQDLFQMRALIHVPVKKVAKGGLFEKEIPSHVDCVYIDAPYVERTEKYDSFTGKPAYMDVPNFLDSGAHPKLIIVDGRTDTVDAILSNVNSGNYSFQGEYIWGLERGHIGSAAHLKRHSVFIKK